jgi:hypothetical protein
MSVRAWMAGKTGATSASIAQRSVAAAALGVDDSRSHLRYQDKTGHRRPATGRGALPRWPAPPLLNSGGKVPHQRRVGGQQPRAVRHLAPQRTEYQSGDPLGVDGCEHRGDRDGHRLAAPARETARSKPDDQSGGLGGPGWAGLARSWRLSGNPRSSRICRAGCQAWRAVGRSPAAWQASPKLASHLWARKILHLRARFRACGWLNASRCSPSGCAPSPPSVS